MGKLQEVGLCLAVVAILATLSVIAILWVESGVEVRKVWDSNGDHQVVSVVVVEDGEPVEKRPEWLKTYNGTYHTVWVSPDYRPSFLTKEEVGDLEAKKLRTKLEEAEALGQTVSGQRLTITGWVIEDNES